MKKMYPKAKKTFQFIDTMRYMFRERAQLHETTISGWTTWTSIGKMLKRVLAQMNVKPVGTTQAQGMDHDSQPHSADLHRES
ncbi:MAG: hypothetical protein U9N14_04360 [Pseudomonadota bacterium]|nr:hypothetical protein [Pseudomonadota bacterium]